MGCVASLHAEVADELTCSDQTSSDRDNSSSNDYRCSGRSLFYVEQLDDGNVPICRGYLQVTAELLSLRHINGFGINESHVTEWPVCYVVKFGFSNDGHFMLELGIPKSGEWHSLKFKCARKLELYRTVRECLLESRPPAENGHIGRWLMPQNRRQRQNLERLTFWTFSSTGTSLIKAAPAVENLYGQGYSVHTDDSSSGGRTQRRTPAGAAVTNSASLAAAYFSLATPPDIIVSSCKDDVQQSQHNLQLPAASPVSSSQPLSLNAL